MAKRAAGRPARSRPTQPTKSTKSPHPTQPSVTFSPEYARIRVPLHDSRDPKSLGLALDTLVDFVTDPKHLLQDEPDDNGYLVTTFHTPARKWIRERIFFARCAKHPELHPGMLAYVEKVNLKARGFEQELVHTDNHPAGSFAIVPLALADPKYLDALIEHFRGFDMDHESFHPSLLVELVRRHGIRPETIRLLAWRAVESDGKSRDTLTEVARDHDLLARLEPFDGLEGFAEVAHALNRRTAYASLYIANGGRALCTTRPDLFERWLAWWEAKGVVFEKSERTPPEAAFGAYSVAKWPDDFEDDAPEDPDG